MNWAGIFNVFWMVVLFCLHKECFSFTMDQVIEPTGSDMLGCVTPEFTSADVATAFCIIDWNDEFGTSWTVTEGSNPSPVCHNYTTALYYDCCLYCNANNLTATACVNVYMGDSIAGFDPANGTGETILPAADAAANGVTFKFVMDKGTNVTATITFLHNGATEVFEDLVAGSNDVTLSSSSFPDDVGLYPIMVNATNPFPSSNVVSYNVIAAQESITGVVCSEYDVSLDIKYVEYNTPVAIDLSLSSGSDVAFVWTTTDSSANTLFIGGKFCDGKITAYTITHTFDTLGDVAMEIDASNFVSYNVSNYNFFSQYRVNNITITCRDTVVFHDINVWCDFTISGAVLVPMGNLVCTLDFDDGTDVNAVNRGLTGADLTGVTLTEAIQHDYAVAGTYILNATCANELDAVVTQITLYVENYVDNLEFVNQSNYIPFSSSEFTAWIVDGPSQLPVDYLSCEVDFNDGNVVTFVGSVSPTSNVTISYFYSRVGMYDITVNCSNRLASKIFQISLEVYTDCFASPDIFDSSLGNFHTPFKWPVTQDLKVQGRLSLTDLCKNATPTFNWTLWYDDDGIEGGILTEVVVPQPFGTIEQTFVKESLRDGMYKLELLANFPDVQDASELGIMYLQLELPDLVASISGGTEVIVSKDEDYTLNAGSSHDPVQTLQHVLVETLVYTWSCWELSSMVNIDDPGISAYVNPYATVQRPPVGATPCTINIPGETQPTIDLNLLTPDVWHLLKFEMTRGARTSSVYTAFYPVTGKPLRVSQECVGGNCPMDANKKVARRTFSLNARFDEPDIDVAFALYHWTVKILDTSVNPPVFVPAPVISNTGFDQQGLEIDGSSLAAGMQYQITLEVDSTQQFNEVRIPGTSKDTWTINHLPYGGTCSIRSRTGTTTLYDVCAGNATLTKFDVTCQDWKDEGTRLETNPLDDSGVNLHFDVLQRTAGSVAGNNLLFFTKDVSLSTSVPLSAATDTQVVVQIKDDYNDVFEYTFDCLVEPFIETNTTEPADPAVVDRFLDVAMESVFESQELASDSSVVSVVASITSQMVAITIAPVEEIAVDVGASSNGLPDSTGGNATNFDSLLDSLQPQALDPVTEKLQNATQELATVLHTRLSDALNKSKNGTGTMSASDVTMFSSAMTSMMAKPDIVNNDTMTLVSMSSDSMAIQLTLLPESEKQGAAEAVQGLVDQLATVVVPDSLTARTGHSGADSARAYIDALQAIAENITDAIEQSVITPDERTFAVRQQERILELQINARREIAIATANSIMAVVQNTQLSITVCVGCKQELDSANMHQTIESNSAQKLAEEKITSSESAVKLDGLAEAGEEELSVNVVNMKKNVFMYDDNGRSSYISSSVGHVEVKSAKEGEERPQREMTFEQEVEIPPPQVVYPTYFEDDASQFSAHLVMIRSDIDHFCVSVRPEDSRVEKSEVYIKLTGRPSLIDYDVKEEVSASSSWKICIHPTQLKGHIGVAYMGTRYVIGSGGSSNRKKRSTDTASGDPKLSPYNLTMITVACMVWNPDSSNWDNDKCEMEWDPDDGKITCYCKEVNSMTFGNSFFVAPNKIDFSTVFLKFSPLSQAAVLATLSLLLIIYILAIVWARRQDKKDILRWGITPLADNFVEENYFYVLRVSTGMRPNAGTRSRVCFVLSGEANDTGVRELNDGVRKEIPTGSVMNFLMSTSGHLGTLQYLRIWHDNSGGGDHASWYLSKIEVYDVQCSETFAFLCERWLAVEQSDGSLESIVPVSGKENMLTFKNRFYDQAKDNVADSHIWISILYRPVTSPFTRVQRVSCAAVFVMLTMIGNAMYFNPGENYENPGAIKLGPFSFTLQQIYISIICALISTPATFFVIFLFKKSRRFYKTEHDLYPNSDKARKYKIPLVQSWLEKRQKESVELEQKLIVKGFPRFQGFVLPSWCNYIAWILVVAGTLVPAFFILLYSMQWGKEKSEEWLTTFLLSFFESVFCLDPFKVLLISLMFAVLFKTIKLGDTHVDRSTIMRNYSGRGVRNGVRLPAPPLSEDNFKKAKEEREKELKMRTALKDVAINIFFLWIIFSISYSNRDKMSYYLHQDVSNRLLAPKGHLGFDQIKTTEGYYKWLNSTVFPNLFPEYDLNGDRLHWRVRQFMKGFASYRLGPPRLRQLRTKKDYCNIPKMGGTDCFGKYEMTDEETGKYCLGWQDKPCSAEETAYKYSTDAWEFTSSLDIWGFPLSGDYTTYGGGGYIAKLDVNFDISTAILNELYENSWIDRQTRSVFFEFTLYCINANLFIYNMFLVEFPETGGTFTFYTIMPLRVYQHVGALGVYTLACEVIYLLFLIIYTIVMIVRIYQQRCKYFKSGWNVLDFLGVVGGYVAVAMYFVRMVMTNDTITKFQEDEKAFVNFMHIAIWDQSFVLLLGILIFIATLRFISVLGYNKRVSSIIRVFTNAAADLIWFGVFFVYMFVTYAVFGYLLFGTTLESYKNVYKTLGTLFISMIGKSRFTEINETDPIMSKIYFMIFILVVVYLIMTMFLAVLNKSIDSVNNENKKDTSEELIDYVLTKFKLILGLQGRNNQPTEEGRHSAPWRYPSNKGDESPSNNFEILQDIRMTITNAFGNKIIPGNTFGGSAHAWQKGGKMVKFRQS